MLDRNKVILNFVTTYLAGRSHLQGSVLALSNLHLTFSKCILIGNSL